ncbi:MAG: LytR/AlgR family response regulator transcription factor [Candidatus Pristimantibacillus sp.]
MERPLSIIIGGNISSDRHEMYQYASNLGQHVVSTVGSGEWLIEDCVKYVPDLVIIEIGLNGTDGLTAYQRILERGIAPYLIIISDTQDSELILAGLKMNCLDFITKPVSFERITEAINKAKVIVEKDMMISKSVPGKMIQIKSNYRNVFINENNLIYASKEKGKHKTILYVDRGDEAGIETYTSISDIQAQCSDFIFCPNRSALININYIKKIFASDKHLGTYIIQLNYNDVEIVLPRRKRKEFENLWNRLRSDF